MKVKSESEVAQSCPTISDPMNCSLPGSSVHGIFQARVLKWGAIAFSDKTGTVLLTASVCMLGHSVVSDFWGPHGLWPGRLSVHGISQARIVEWVAISYSRGSS